MTDLPKLRDYIKRLQWWRDMYEQSLDVRPRTQPLDAGGCNLTDFHHTKFDEIEIPGQYVHVSKRIHLSAKLTCDSTSSRLKNSSRSRDSYPKSSWAEVMVTASAVSQ